MREYRKADQDTVRAKWKKYASKYRANHREEVLAADRKRAFKRYPVSDKSAREMMHRARSLLPAGLPPDIRDDVAAAVIMAVFDGRIVRKFTAKHVKLFLAEYNREHSAFKTVSLDDVMTADGATRGGLMGIY